MARCKQPAEYSNTPKAPYTPCPQVQDSSEPLPKTQSTRTYVGSNRHVPEAAPGGARAHSRRAGLGALGRVPAGMRAVVVEHLLCHAVRHLRHQTIGLGSSAAPVSCLRSHSSHSAAQPARSSLIANQGLSKRSMIWYQITSQSPRGWVRAGHARRSAVGEA